MAVTCYSLSTLSYSFSCNILGFSSQQKLEKTGSKEFYLIVFYVQDSDEHGALLYRKVFVFFFLIESSVCEPTFFVDP